MKDKIFIYLYCFIFWLRNFCPNRPIVCSHKECQIVKKKRLLLVGVGLCRLSVSTIKNDNQHNPTLTANTDGQQLAVSVGSYVSAFRLSAGFDFHHEGSILYIVGLTIRYLKTQHSEL